MTTTPRFLAACRREPVDRPPVWLMRQAGRYMAEYRAVREKAGSFMNLCRTPEWCIEVTLQPIRRFGFDAAILFSDILIPAEAMGAEVSFVAGEGPRIGNPVRDEAGVDALRCPEPEEACPFVYETIRGLRSELDAETPLITFVAAPWTLMCYLVEGGGSKHFERTKTLLMGRPDLAKRLLDKIVAYSARHAAAGLRAGAQALQLFDTWAELLAPADYAGWALPAANEVFRRVRAEVGPEPPFIYFSKGSAGQLPVLGAVEADVVSIDWRLDLARARRELGESKALQGNLDPLALLAGPEATRERTRAVLEAGGGRGHIVNLGHGILPQTPLESVDALLETVRGGTP
ncbi:MAG: uroporphyrinogen decarboxylase [Planctomycetota bacterium]|nr:MAG: uroporphyrinogen decarboxylase [Planctomycetota bacterium]